MEYIKRKFRIVLSILRMVLFDASNKGEVTFRIMTSIGWQIYKRLFKFPIVLPLDNGLIYIADPRAVNSTGVIYTKIYESDYILFIRNNCNNGGVMVDVGAHTGLYTLLLNDCINKAVLFEPDPNTCKLLKRNIAINLMEDVTIYQAAASDHSGSGSLRIEGNYSGLNHITDNSDNQFDEVISIDLVTVDEALSALQINTVDLIKIDTEGHELNVLQGCKEVLNNSPGALVLYENSNFEEIYKFFDGMGFKIFGLDANGGIIADKILLKSCYNLFSCGPKNKLYKKIISLN